MLLKDDSCTRLNFLTADEILQEGINYFKVDNPEKLVKRYRYKDIMLIRHILRYTMWMNGIHFTEIAKTFKCDRTTSYRSIFIVNQLSYVDLDFRNKVNGFNQHINSKL